VSISGGNRSSGGLGGLRAVQEKGVRPVSCALKIRHSRSYPTRVCADSRRYRISSIRAALPCFSLDGGDHTSAIFLPQIVTGPNVKQSFWTRVTAFLGHRMFHKQYRERDHKRQHGDHPKGVEISKRRPLLLAQILELLPSELLRRGRIAGLLKEERLGQREKRSHRRVEGIKILAKSGSCRRPKPAKPDL
jgi:hypothetical protein